MTVKVLGTEEIGLDMVTSFPGNARRGNIRVIAESILEHGQYRSLIVRRRAGKPDQLLCGHSTRDALAACRIAVARAEIIDCDDDEARKINAVDNRSQELAEWDMDALAVQLEMFGDDLTGTGFTADDAAKIMFKGMPEPGDAPTDEDGAGAWGVVIECETEDEQVALLDELAGRGLKVRALIQG
jgi:hypothetical protein